MTPLGLEAGRGHGVRQHTTIILWLEAARAWPAGVGSPASPGGAQLPRMAAVRGRFMALGEQAEQQPLQSTQRHALG